MKSMVDRIKDLVSDEEETSNDETVEATINNLNSALLKISQNLLESVSQGKQDFSVKEAKDIASIVSSLSNIGNDSVQDENGQLPSSPSPINVFYNTTLGATDKESEDDDESDISKGLDSLSEEQVKEMLDDTNKLKDTDNYEHNIS